MCTVHKENAQLALSSSLLRWCCDPSSLPFETTDELDGGEIFLGQQRAKKAMEVGLQIEGPGYHILVCGPPGTGRKTLIRSLIHNSTNRKGQAKDLIYVNNFKDPSRPLAITLPRGKGYAFREEMDSLLAFLQEKIPAFLNEGYIKARRESVIKDHERRVALIRESFRKEVKKRSFSTTGEELGGGLLPQCTPCADQGPVDMETLAARARKGEIPREAYQRWQKDYRELSKIRKRLIVQWLDAEKCLKEKAAKDIRSVIEDLIHLRLLELRRKFKDRRVREFLGEVEKALLNECSRLGSESYQEQKDIASPHKIKDPFLQFRANLLIDNRDACGPPVEFEPFPSVQNVFGTIAASRSGEDSCEPEFLTIRPGALHKAFGGYLILDLKDVVHDHGAWTNLKHCLKRNLIDISPSTHPTHSPTTLRPEPFPLDVKVIALVGEDLYQAISNDDPEMDELFKIRADFDEVLDRTQENIIGYCSFLHRVCAKESLLPFHRTGAAAMVETGVERAGRQSKLSARLADIADIAREAAYWARQEGSPLIHRQHVEKALRERRHRNNLLDEQFRELIQEGTIHIETTGANIGQVNGIALYDLGEDLFAKPCRITAQTSMGRAGVINIEREANLSGKFHDKGILILYGYLRDRYAHDKPLNLSASICIEQFYADIEGDSASLAEICALLSSLSGIAVKQGIAVTGSISQKGEVQSVGCVNEKVVGFFEVCRTRGLNGEQGVIIPGGNATDLMLPMEILDAVEAGRFHIYQVHTVDDAMELLTGWRAGRKGGDDAYPTETINRMVDDRLRELAENLRDFYNEVAEEDERWEQE